MNAQSRIKPPTPNNLLGTLLHRIATLILTISPAIMSICALNIGLCEDKKSVPNIVLILADDMGYSDIGCYGGEIHTPNLNTLAGNGLRFTQFYNTARCCPTRAALLTGLYPHQAGIGHMMEDRGHDGYRGVLNQRCVTISEVLKASGYRTYMCGKWHVTRFTAPDGDKTQWPLQRGFEKFYGTITGAGNFYDPAMLCRQNQYITPHTDTEYKPSSYYYTDALSDNAVKFLDEHFRDTPDKPFFMYLAYTAAHWPLHALENDMANYRGKYDVGYKAIREARFSQMKSLGLLPTVSSLPPGDADWNKVEHKPWEARCMEAYAGMIHNMDVGIGRVLQRLRTERKFENTLILYLQDNGGCAEEIGRQPPAESPPDHYEPFAPDHLISAIQPRQTRDGRPVRRGPNVMPGPEDTYIAYGKHWAQVSNTPFREYKHWVHEGGISTPLIAHWPQGIPAARNGMLESQPGHLIDIMATCVDLAGANYPAKQNEILIQPMEGVSLRRAFQDSPLERKEPLFWEHEGNRALREGDWKIVAKDNQSWELYNLTVDRAEQNNLTATESDRLKSMSQKWESMAERLNVLPLGTWKKNPKENKKIVEQNKKE
jgi:arylsulfatase A-like enzyme